jgi:hypothetical protein
MISKNKIDDFIIKKEFGHNFLIKYNGHDSSPVLPEEIDIIGRSAFENCDFLTDITIPNYVIEIRENAFSHCANLKSVNMLEGKNTWGGHRFYGVKVIGKSAFNGCISLSKIQFPRSLLVIGENAFSGCESLPSIALPNIVTIRDSAFADCSSLTDVQILSEIEEVGSGAFKNCAALSTVNFNEVLIIGKGAFEGCSALSNVQIQYLLVIEERAFLGCTSLSSFEVPNSVDYIGERVFKGCSALSEVRMLSVERIYERAFLGCTSLSSFEVPNGVQKISENAFEGCSSLPNLQISNSLEYLEEDALLRTQVLKNQQSQFPVPKGKRLTSRSAEIGVEIPEYVTYIGIRAYANNQNIRTVNIPSSMKRIGFAAFEDCTNLNSLVISQGVEEIGRFAFANCSSLTSVEIPGSVKKIGSGAFKGCNKLDKLIISEGVEEIGESAFAGCSSLSIVEIPGSVREIAESTFSGCLLLSKLKIKKSVGKIGQYAFHGCESLAEVIIDQCVGDLDMKAFDNLGQREVSIIYHHTSPTITNFGENNSKYIFLLDKENKIIGKLYNPDESPEILYVKFIARLLMGCVKHLSEYDSLFSNYISLPLKKIKIALTRLQYPLELNQVYKDNYLSYLQNFAHYYVPFLIKINNVEQISSLASVNVLYKQDIDTFIDQAMQLKRTEIQAFLMDYKNKTWGLDKISRMNLYGEEDQDSWLTYENDDGSLTIKKYVGGEVNVTIPSKIMDKLVKTIDGWNIGDIKINVFSTKRDEIQSIVIEDGIEVIGDRAFLECHNLSSIVIPASIKEICKEAFYGCENLAIHAPIGSYAIQYAKEKEINYEEI